MSKTQIEKRPWADRAEDLFASEGPYADFAAWEEWIEDASPQVAAMDLYDRIEVYSAMCELVRQFPDSAVFQR